MPARKHFKPILPQRPGPVAAEHLLNRVPARFHMVQGDITRVCSGSCPTAIRQAVLDALRCPSSAARCDDLCNSVHYANIARLKCGTEMALSTAAIVDAQLPFAPRRDTGACSAQHLHVRDGRPAAAKICKYCWRCSIAVPAARSCWSIRKVCTRVSTTAPEQHVTLQLIGAAEDTAARSKCPPASAAGWHPCQSEPVRRAPPQRGCSAASAPAAR